MKFGISIKNKFVKTMLSLLAIVFAAGICDVVSAQTTDEASEKARARAYPGGKDEDRIQVQATLPDPEKKFTDKAIQNQVLKRDNNSNSN